MKKILALVLAMMLMLSLVPAHAAQYLGFFNQLDDEATLDWLEDASAKGPEVVSQYYNNGSRTYKPSSLLADYPAKTAVVYRSAGFYGGQTAVRNNTSITVFVEKQFADLGEAEAYLNELGLIDLIDSVIGSVVLVTPADGKAFGEADLANYYNLHAARFNQRTTETIDEVSYTHADSEYYGAYGKVYAIGIDGGATFFNNYIAPGDKWVIGLFAGVLLVNGEMNEDVVISNYVPTYLVNGTETALNAYKAVNGVDVNDVDGEKEIFSNSIAPLRKVMVLNADTADLKPIVEDAFFSLFMEAQRLKNISSAEALPNEEFYLDVLAAPAPQLYSLSPRNAIINGVALNGGLVVTAHHTDMFSDVQTPDGEYLEFWYDALPEAVINNTAPAHSVPLVLALHGTQDDPLMFMDEIGWLDVAGEENIAVISPFTEGLVTVMGPGNEETSYTTLDGIMKIAIPRLVNYMLETYPALDPARVYASGYSMGGGSTYRAAYGGKDMFAACAPQAGMAGAMLYGPGSEVQPDEADVLGLQLVGMPTMIMTSTNDLGFDKPNSCLTADTLFSVYQFAAVNGLEVPEATDFEAYPMIGMPTDEFEVLLLNGEWRDFRWICNNEAGVPVLGINCIEYLSHTLYAGHAQVAYDYMKHFSRDLETGLSIYTPEL